MLRNTATARSSPSSAPSPAPPRRAADVVTDWNDLILDGIRAHGTNPPVATRSLAMLHTAVFDAVDGIVGGYQPYAVAGPGPAGASPEAAAAAAAHAVLVVAYPDMTAALRRRARPVAGGHPRRSGEDGRRGLGGDLRRRHPRPPRA